MSKVSDTVRTSFKEADEKRDAGLETPAEIQRYDDIAYGEDQCQVLDIYRPKAIEGKLPVIVSVHGGGWVYGDKERYQYYCMDLAKRGFAVVNFTYRLAPEHKFPACMEDTNLVFSWVLDHTEQYGFERENVFAVGDSAGAHILGLYTAICTDAAYASKYLFTSPKGFVPKAIALNCGAYDLTAYSEKDGNRKQLIAEFMPKGGTEEELKQICVLDYVSSHFPPVFVMTATGDFLKEQAVLLAGKLMEYDVPFVVRYYGDSEHELGHVFHLNMRSEIAKQCNDAECEFFMKEKHK